MVRKEENKKLAFKMLIILVLKILNILNRIFLKNMFFYDTEAVTNGLPNCNRR